MKENRFLEILTRAITAIVSLSVGSAMISKTLTIPIIPSPATEILGWIVIIGATTNIALTIFKN